MQIWVGLGNPGPRYALHRHNVGFMAADVIADMHGFGAVQKKFQSWAQEGRIGAHKVLLLKPATFMNESGRSVSEALRFYKLGTEALTVFHDELDLAPFKVKVRVGGGLAGHNGLRSIDAALGPDFRRVRIGIGHPGDRAEVSNWVLRKPPLEDRIAIDKCIADSLATLPLLLAGDLAGATMKIHAKPQRPKPPRQADGPAGAAEPVLPVLPVQPAQPIQPIQPAQPDLPDSPE
jgi:PTH1 family peptidyl-tRNA hydrolase